MRRKNWKHPLPISTGSTWNQLFSKFCANQIINAHFTHIIFYWFRLYPRFVQNKLFLLFIFSVQINFQIHWFLFSFRAHRFWDYSIIVLLFLHYFFVLFFLLISFLNLMCTIFLFFLLICLCFSCFF